MSGRVRGAGAAFWLTGMIVFSALFLSFFRLLPWALNRMEPRYIAPTVLLSGQIVIRSDAGGEGYFGASRSNNRTHSGIDIAAPLNEPVFSAKSGRVAYAGPKGGYGNFIRILHPGGGESRYAHLAQIDVAAGDWVSRGRVIGRIGKTGNANSSSIAPHLHFEIRREDTPLDPLEYIESGRKLS